MNIFRIIGDLMHLASIILLLWKIRAHKSAAGKGSPTFKDDLTLVCRFYLPSTNPSQTHPTCPKCNSSWCWCSGVSLKSQELYALVFVTRYLDLLWNFSSLYNSVMKLIFLASSFSIIYMTRFKYKHTYDKDHDSFRVLFLIIPCAILALIFNPEPTFSEVKCLNCLSMFSSFLLHIVSANRHLTTLNQQVSDVKR